MKKFNNMFRDMAFIIEQITNCLCVKFELSQKKATQLSRHDFENHHFQKELL